MFDPAVFDPAVFDTGPAANTGGRLTITDSALWNIALTDVERSVTTVNDS